MAKRLLRPAQFALTLFGLFAFHHTQISQGAMIVNPARPITHRVDVQIIQTSLSSGSPQANVFGNAAQRASIEASIDMVWAQAGIDVNFLPSVTTYANTFAFQGTTPPLQMRPFNDLDSIITSANGAGKTNFNSHVINMFFVEITPGFVQLGPYSVSGIANIGNNGIAAYVGDSMLGIQVNREIVAGVVAHEIGHNLGLNHTASGIANLMSNGGTTDQLTQQQIDYIFQAGTFFLQPATPAGDFTGDGVVNGADLSVWQIAYGVTANGDGDSDGDSDGRDFLAWQKQYGSHSIVATSRAIPEPTTGGLGLAALAGFFLLQRRKRPGRSAPAKFPRRYRFALTA